MPRIITTVLKPLPATPSPTIAVVASQHTQSTAALSAQAGVTAAQAPANASAPAQIPVPVARNSLTIINPLDGALVYIGQDATVTPATGHALYPGNQLGITSYTGQIWAVGASGGSPLFFSAS